MKVENTKKLYTFTPWQFKLFPSVFSTEDWKKVNRKLSKHEWMQSCYSRAIIVYWIAQNYSIKTHIRPSQIMRVPFK